MELDQRALVTWRIYDVRGALVRTIASEPMDAGPHERTWDGRDDRGNVVASGVYMNVVDAGRFHASQKIVLLK